MHANLQEYRLAEIKTLPISARVDKAFGTETVNSGSIPGRVIPKTLEVNSYSFPALLL